MFFNSLSTLISYLEINLLTVTCYSFKKKDFREFSSLARFFFLADTKILAQISFFFQILKYVNKVKMIVHSSRLLFKNQRVLQLGRRFSSHLKNKTVNHEQTQTTQQKLKPFESIQDKIKHVSTTALSRYNEVVGFKEIDQAYEKISSLQVKLLGFSQIFQIFMSIIFNCLFPRSLFMPHKMSEHCFSFKYQIFEVSLLTFRPKSMSIKEETSSI